MLWETLGRVVVGRGKGLSCSGRFCGRMRVLCMRLNINLSHKVMSIIYFRKTRLFVAFCCNNVVKFSFINWKQLEKAF